VVAVLEVATLEGVYAPAVGCFSDEASPCGSAASPVKEVAVLEVGAPCGSAGSPVPGSCEEPTDRKVAVLEVVALEGVYAPSVGCFSDEASPCGSSASPVKEVAVLGVDAP
jgi:tetrahydromethanopterin S-methyltransferase subunit E